MAWQVILPAFKPLENRQTMFTHIMVGTNDIARSKKFYDAVFAALNIPPSETSSTGGIT